MTTITHAEDVQPDDQAGNLWPNDILDPLRSLLRWVEPVGVFLDFAGATLDDYDRLMRTMHLAPNGPALPGCLFHWAHSTSDGLRICEVWRNRGLFEFFQREEALPVLQCLKLPEPELHFYPVHNYLAMTDLVDGTDHGRRSPLPKHDVLS
jgi:hypothetical protein